MEVLVALAVLAIGLGAIIKAGTTATYNLGHLRDKTISHWVVMNVVNEFQLREQWPAPGTSSGKEPMAGRQWRWEARVTPTPDADMRRLDVEAGPDQGEGASASLVAFLPRPVVP